VWAAPSSTTWWTKPARSASVGLSLETGTVEAFGPARSLYQKAGFTPCEPFASYLPSPNSTFMTLSLDSPERP
jgi:putative acetyltransferase